MISLLLLSGLLFAIFYRSFATTWKNYRHAKRLSAFVPGGEGVPFFGNMFELECSTEAVPRELLRRAKMARDEWNGEIVKLWLMHQSAYFPFTGEMNQYILESTEEIHKGDTYAFFESWLGLGLLLEGGDRWRAKRKMITPSFHFTMLNDYVDTMIRHTKILASILENHVGKELDIDPFMKRFTLDVICETAMGKDLDSQHNHNQPYAKAISKLMKLGCMGTLNPIHWNKFGRWITGWQKKHDDNVKIAHDFTLKVIEERIKLVNHEGVDTNRKAFLDRLISEKERSNLSMEEIREEVDTFMFAGHDTTSKALGWSIWCLAHHQDIQRKAYEEVKEIFGDDMDRDCTKEDLTRMNYLERCIKETLRLFPSVPFVGRHLVDDLKMGTYVVPRESVVCISPYLLHRNERIYPEPEKFDPDRFLPENSVGRHTYDYIPFSAGPRNCIGQKFAMYQLKIALGTLLRKYRFSSKRKFNSVTILSEVVLTAKEGVNIIVENR